MADDNYIDFDQAREILGISQGELEDLVGDGKLRAFRVGGETKFKEADVQELSGQSTDATLISEGDADLAEEAAEDLLEDGTEEIVFEDEDFDEDTETTELDVEVDDATTKELTLDDGNVFDTEEDIATEEVDLEEVEAEGRRPLSSRRRSAASRRIAEFPIEKPSTLVTVFLILTLLTLVLTSMVYFQQIKYHTKDSYLPGHLKFFTDNLTPTGK
jgi:excisionase family DNA binding protein